MAPGSEEPMFKSSLTMLDHSPAALRADESRQAQASYSLIATGTGSAVRLMPGSDTNLCLRSRTNFRREPSGPRRVRPFTDSAYSPDSPVHCPLTSWTTLRALSWTATKNGSSEAAVITFMGHSHYPDQVLGSNDWVIPLSRAKSPAPRVSPL